MGRLVKPEHCALCQQNYYHEVGKECCYGISGGGVSPPVGVSPPPPAEPHIIAAPQPGAGNGLGSMWVESSELHYISSGQIEYAETGASVATPPGAVIGSIWQESDDIHYIDASGVERTVSKQTMPAAPAGAVTGSIWVENSAPTPQGQQVQWIGAALARFKWWNGI